MSSLIRTPIPNITAIRCCYQNQISLPNYHTRFAFPKLQVNRLSVYCSKLTPWEPTALTYTPTDETEQPELLEETRNIFETLKFEDTEAAPASDSEKLAQKNSNPSNEPSGFLKWPSWILGPVFLLLTGMVPTLWLPLSSIFVGPNIASLLSLVGLDCIFNLGATLFLLMAHSTTQPKDPMDSPKSKAPFSYQFWNIVASIIGYIVPLVLLFGSQKGFLEPHLPPISYLVLLGPYLLLLSVQILTELLTWHWQSPVWLVTPVIYEAYRVLQLMRGLKLSAEISAPGWVVHTIRGLVCWWVLVLGLQLMRVAWFAGFSAKSRQVQT